MKLIRLMCTEDCTCKLKALNKKEFFKKKSNTQKNQKKLKKEASNIKQTQTQRNMLYLQMVMNCKTSLLNNIEILISNHVHLRMQGNLLFSFLRSIPNNKRKEDIKLKVNAAQEILIFKIKFKKSKMLIVQVS